MPFSYIGGLFIRCDYSLHSLFRCKSAIFVGRKLVASFGVNYFKKMVTHVVAFRSNIAKFGWNKTTLFLGQIE